MQTLTDSRTRDESETSRFAVLKVSDTTDFVVVFAASVATSLVAVVAGSLSPFSLSSSARFHSLINLLRNYVINVSHALAAGRLPLYVCEFGHMGTRGCRRHKERLASTVAVLSSARRHTSYPIGDLRFANAHAKWTLLIAA